MGGKGKIEAKITERGWPGHFICADRCMFRRNTLVEVGRNKYVVSSVGLMKGMGGQRWETIGAFGRYYETMVFRAQKEGPYWEADVSRQVGFKSDWDLSWDSPEKIPQDSDARANEMHDAVVREIATIGPARP